MSKFLTTVLDLVRQGHYRETVAYLVGAAAIILVQRYASASWLPYVFGGFGGLGVLGAANTTSKKGGPGGSG